MVATIIKTHHYADKCKIRVERRLDQTRITIRDRYANDTTTLSFYYRMDRNELRLKIYNIAKERGFRK